MAIRPRLVGMFSTLARKGWITRTVGTCTPLTLLRASIVSYGGRPKGDARPLMKRQSFVADSLKIDLDERQDGAGKTYLFGSIKLFNAVLFVRQTDGGKWFATVKAYEPSTSTNNNGKQK